MAVVAVHSNNRTTQTTTDQGYVHARVQSITSRRPFFAEHINGVESFCMSRVNEVATSRAESHVSQEFLNPKIFGLGFQ
jgi:hypothetical protein